MKKGNSQGKAFIAKKKESPVLDDGRHVMEVVGISETEAKEYPTPQIEVVMKSESGIKHTNWYNLAGYQKDEDGEYILDKNGKRVISDENTEVAVEMFLGFAVDCGIEDGVGFDLDDLNGLSVGVNIITNDQGYKRVQYSLPADQVSEESLF